MLSTTLYLLSHAQDPQEILHIINNFDQYEGCLLELEKDDDECISATQSGHIPS